ncbi:MAG: GGDEF domain-containing protein [Gammaproteobacteria bacterium]|nr:MAG: GGDEF domain-containing protein [Gammaproteobacteria bacterium]
MVETTEDKQQEKWKEKYRNSLDTIESLQQQSELLKKCIVRVSLIADGINPEINKHLQALREMIRNNCTDYEIESKIDILSEELKNLEDQNGRQKNPLFDNFPLLVQPLQKAPLSNDLLKKINLLSRQIKKSPDSITAEELVSGYTSIIAEAIGIGNTELTDADYELSEQKPGLLKRLFNKDESEELSGFDSDKNIPENIQKTLINLLDHLILPDAFKEKAKSIRKSLKRGLSINQLPETLNEIVSLVVDSASEETHEFEDFLQQVADQLAELYKYLSSIGVAANDSNKLGADVKSSVEIIRQNISQAKDISTLKESIQSQLIMIVDNVDDFCSAQAEKQSETNARIEVLKKRLLETEEESALLRERLVVQRAHAQLDPLTKLPNRQAYDHQLNSEFSRWQRYGKPLTLIIADIDFFKKINDNFGHAAGDKVLKTVARVLQANLRETDFIARFGGEEFVIIMPETTGEDASKVADKLRVTVNDCPFHSNNEKVPVTISFGVAEFKKEDSCEAVFDKADKALYKSKENGRNQVSLA